MKRDGTLPKHKFLVYTGQIDSYYAALGMPKLEYHSLRFEEEYVEGVKDEDADDADADDDSGLFFQEAMVVNYPGPDVPFTRIVEYKHMPNLPKVDIANRHARRPRVLERDGRAVLPRPQPRKPRTVRKNTRN